MITPKSLTKAIREGKRKLSDRDGLYLYLSPTGAKSWRYDYRFGGRRYTLTHGGYFFWNSTSLRSLERSAFVARSVIS